MAHDVFISYSSTDQPAALAVLHGLESAGVRCWMAPRDIPPGAIWASSIIDGINGCRVMVVVFSASANRSAHVINEVDAAVRKGAIIVPFRIENVMPDGAMEFHLRTRHWLDALTPDLEEHTTRLAEQIKVLLATPRSTFTPTPPPKPMPDDLPPRRTTPPPVPAPIPPPVRPTNWRLYKWVALAAVVLIAVAAFLNSRERPVSHVTFTIIQNSASGGNQSSLLVSTDSLRFFEGGNPMPSNSQRRYTTTFPAGSTRYIYPEVSMKSEAPGRVVSVPISCEIFGAGGAVSGAVIINGEIQPTWTETLSAHGYGSESAGTWKPGHYRADCRYGTTLINRAWFDVVAGAISGAAPGTPPAPPPVAEGPLVTSQPLRSINARVTGIRFFEAGNGYTAPADRSFATSFSSAAARYIKMEVDIKHDAPGRITYGQLNCRYLRADGSVYGSVTIHYTIQPDWTATGSTEGWGDDKPGTWRPGSYSVTCDDGQINLGRASFDVN